MHTYVLQSVGNVILYSVTAAINYPQWFPAIHISVRQYSTQQLFIDSYKTKTCLGRHILKYKNIKVVFILNLQSTP